MKFSVTQVGLPHLELEECCTLLEELGFDALELRVRNASPGLASDVSPTNVLGKADEIKQLLADHGLSCCAFAASCEASELDEVRLLAEGAAAVGCPLVRLGCRRYPADGSLDYNEMFDEAVAHYAAALEVTRSFGVKIIVEMHGGTLHPSASLAHRIVSNFSSDNIGVIYDPQNMVMDGFETTPLAIQLLGDYLAHVHIGAHEPIRGELNADGVRQWTFRRTSMWEGLYDIQQMMGLLSSRGYSGAISIEDLGGTDARGEITPEAKIEEGLAFLKRMAKL